MVSRVLNGVRTVLDVLRDAAGGWIAHKAPRAAAALAFYALLSFAPTVTVGLTITDAFLTEGEARASVVEVARVRIGPRAARALDWLLDRSSGTSGGVLGIVTLLMGATVGFAQLQSALNDAWRVEADPDRPFIVFVRKRALSFVMVIVIAGFMLALSIFSTFLKMGAAELKARGIPAWAWLRIGEFVLGVILTTMLVAAIYKILPDAEISWRHVIVGSAVTAMLQGVGRYGVGAYLSRAVLSGGSETLGEPLLALLLYAYFSAMIFLFGAEITRANAERSTGESIRPTRGARRTGGATVGDGKVQGRPEC